MIFHRLAVQRIIEYFRLTNLLDPPTATEEKTKSTEIKLNTNKTMNMTVSLLMSILGTLICLTLPFAMLERPLESFANDWPDVRAVMEWLEKRMDFIDRIIVATTILLILVAADTIIDAIQNTNIKVSPWVQRGKYFPRNYKAQSLKLK